MFKNILSVLIFLFIISFLFLVINTYISENHKFKVMNNRIINTEKIKDNVDKLTILINDTDNVIEFNSGFENKNNKIDRNFWKLFIKND